MWKEPWLPLMSVGLAVGPAWSMHPTQSLIFRKGTNVPPEFLISPSRVSMTMASERAGVVLSPAYLSYEG